MTQDTPYIMGEFLPRNNLSEIQISVSHNRSILVFFLLFKEKGKNIISSFHPEYFFLKKISLYLYRVFTLGSWILFFFFISSFLPVLTLDTNFFKLILSTNPWTQISIHKMIQHFKIIYLGTKNVFLCFGLF